MTTPYTEPLEELAALTEQADGDTPIVSPEAAVAWETTPETPVAPEPTVAPGPVTEPVPTPAVPIPTPITPVPAPLNDYERQHYQELERAYQEQELRTQAMEQARTVEQEITTIRVSLESAGHDPNAIEAVLAPLRAEKQKTAQIVTYVQQSQALQQRKQSAISYYSQQSGMPAADLARFDTQESMAWAASQYKIFEDYKKSSDRRISDLERGRVPDQEFDNSGGTSAAPTSGQALEEAIGNGSVNINAPGVRERYEQYLQNEGFVR